MKYEFAFQHSTLAFGPYRICFQFLPILNHPSRAIGLNFGLNLYIHPLFVYASSEGTGHSAHWLKTKGRRWVMG